MKKYICPQLELIDLQAQDVLTASVLTVESGNAIFGSTIYDIDESFWN